MNFRILLFIIYTIIWDGSIIGGCAYAVFVLGHSGWWFVVAMLIAGSQFKPWHFGIIDKPKEEEEPNP